jgi:hypothetical protein
MVGQIPRAEDVIEAVLDEVTDGELEEAKVVDDVTVEDAVVDVV